MAGDVPGRVSGEVEIRRHGSAEVAESDMHGDADTTFQRSADVVAVPRDTLGYVGVDSAGEEEATRVLDLVRIRSEEHDETDNTESRC